LKRNLVLNGGYVDEVHFMARPSNPDDLPWLDMLVQTSPAYKKIDQAGITKMCRIGESGEEECETADYNNAWKHATELDTMYIKIDDDIVSSAYWYFLPIL